MWTSISLGAGLAATLTGLFAVIWLAKKLSTSHDRELGEVKTNADLSKKVDGLGRAVEDRDHALDAVNEQLHEDFQQARLLAEKHRDELLKMAADHAPARDLVDGIRRELGLLQNLSSPAPAPGGAPADPVHGTPPTTPRP